MIGRHWPGLREIPDPSSPSDEGGRLGEVEDPPGPRVGVETVGEVGLGAAGLEHEGEPAVLGQRREPHVGWEALGVRRGLPLHTRQGSALRLGLDHPDDPLVDVEQVVGATMACRHGRLAACHTLSCKQVEGPAVLHRPAGVGELPVD
jgi:hypothetical protein